MDASQKPADRDGIDSLDIHLGELHVILVDPEAAAKLRDELRALVLRVVTWARITVDDPGFAPADQFGSDQLEIMGVGNFADELAAFFTLLGFLLEALAAVVVGFVLALVDDLLNSLFLFFGFSCVEHFVVFLDEPADLLAIDVDNFICLDFC